MLHRLCGSPSIPLSFILANVLPRWITYCVCCGTDGSYPPTPSNHRLRRGLPGYLDVYKRQSTPSATFKKLIHSYNAAHEDKLPDISLHDLRHTSATLLISQNVDVQTVSSLSLIHISIGWFSCSCSMISIIAL